MDIEKILHTGESEGLEQMNKNYARIEKGLKERISIIKNDKKKYDIDLMNALFVINYDYEEFIQKLQKLREEYSDERVNIFIMALLHGVRI